MIARLRLLTVIALLAVTIIGLGLKSYTGSGRWWFNNWGASVMYELFFMLVAFFWLPRRRFVIPIALTVCCITCLLECLQLWHPPPLEVVRSTFVGRMVLGHAFSWWDFPAYPMGCLMGWWLCRRLAGATAHD